MQHTIAAVYDNRTHAQQAQDELIAAGFSRDTIHLAEADGGAQQDQASPAAGTSQDERSMGSGIRQFFANIFGTARSEDARIYADAVSRGRYVLTLTGQEESEAERAADILASYGPIDIDEDEHAAALLRSDGAARQPQPQRDLGAQQQSTQGSMQSGQMSQSGSMQGSATQGSQQRADAGATAIPVVQEELRVGKREVQRGGVRVVQRVVETP